MRKFIHILSTSVVLFTACDFFDREINIEIPEHEPRIVVNALLEAGKEEVRLAITESIGMSDTTSMLTPLRPASVSLTRNGVALSNPQFDTETGHYVAQTPVREGDSFDLEVSAEGFEPVFAQTEIPTFPQIRNVRVGGNVFDFGGWEKKEISFTIQDIPGQDDYYAVRFIQEREDFQRFHGIGVDSPITWMNYTFGGLAFSDAAFRDGEAVITLWVDIHHFDRIPDQAENFLVVESISRSSYIYQTEFINHHYNLRPDIFGGEPFPLQSQVAGGFGLFGSLAATREQLVW